MSTHLRSYMFYSVKDIPSCDKNDKVTDPHCGSYWDCEQGRSIPVCCPIGESFNTTTRRCEEDPLIPCNEQCPSDYEQCKNLFLHYL